MPKRLGLSKCDIIAFVPIVNVARAKAFYRDVLGLRLVMEEPPFALEFETNGILLRLVMLKKLPAGYGSVVGWKVPDITAAAKGLLEGGVSFERYPYLEQDKLGIWTSPTGAKVAWFKDPDGEYPQHFATSGPEEVSKTPGASPGLVYLCTLRISVVMR